jgi:hypothetical protein
MDTAAELPIQNNSGASVLSTIGSGSRPEPVPEPLI